LLLRATTTAESLDIPFHCSPRDLGLCHPDISTFARITLSAPPREIAAQTPLAFRSQPQHAEFDLNTCASTPRSLQDRASHLPGSLDLTSAPATERAHRETAHTEIHNPICGPELPELAPSPHGGVANLPVT
jgi:hypothetical protein